LADKEDVIRYEEKLLVEGSGCKQNTYSIGTDCMMLGK
jgi:hypothetical protein